MNTAGWSTLDDSLEAAAKWLENPELIDSQKGELENLIGFTQLYVSTKNPIYAWEAFLWLSRSRPIPDWIQLFVEDQGCAIVGLANDKSITPELALEKLPAAIGLKGGGNAFRKHRKDNRKAHVTVTLDQLEADREKTYLARETTAKGFGISPNTAATYQKDTHANWGAQQDIIDKAKDSKNTP